VFGLAMLDKKLYVLRQRTEKQIYVYDASSDKYELTDNYITLPGFSVTDEGWNDMTECEPEKCLFVSDFKAKCIHKVCLKSGAKVRILRSDVGAAWRIKKNCTCCLAVRSVRLEPAISRVLRCHQWQIQQY